VQAQRSESQAVAAAHAAQDENNLQKPQEIQP
jgi:hypothetical protein